MKAPSRDSVSDGATRAARASPAASDDGGSMLAHGSAGVLARAVRAWGHICAAVALLLLGVIAAAFCVLGIWSPPAYAAWALQGPAGFSAGVILLGGTVLWGLLAIALFAWMIGRIRRVHRILTAREFKGGTT